MQYPLGRLCQVAAGYIRHVELAELFRLAVFDHKSFIGQNQILARCNKKFIGKSYDVLEKVLNSITFRRLIIGVFHHAVKKGIDGQTFSSDVSQEWCDLSR